MKNAYLRPPLLLLRNRFPNQITAEIFGPPTGSLAAGAAPAPAAPAGLRGGGVDEFEPPPGAGRGRASATRGGGRGRGKGRGMDVCVEWHTSVVYSRAVFFTFSALSPAADRTSASSRDS